MFRKIFVVFFLLLSLPALAGPNIQHFRPAADPFGLIITQGARVVPKNEMHLAVLTNYAQKPLEMTGVGNSEHLFSFDLTGAVGIFRRYQIWFDIPFTLSQDLSGTLAGIQNAHGLGDVRFGDKMTLVDKKGWGLAMSSLLVVPTGDSDNLLGDEGVGLGGDLIFDKRAERWLIAVNLGYHGRTQQNTLSNLSVKHEFKFGAGASYEIFDGVAAQFEVAGRTAFRDNVSSPIEVLGSVKKDLNSHWQVVGGGGVGINDGYGAPAWRVFLGFGWRPNLKEKNPFSSLSPVHFVIGESELSLDSYRILDDIVVALQNSPEKTLEIHGHTDATGDHSSNQTLSRKRAKLVQGYLLKRGISFERLKIVIHGETDLQEKISGESAVNRRVDFIFK